jgi:hypothetical protein
LPSKQFEFGGKAITFELKFARHGVNHKTLRAIKADFQKITRLFDILDNRGQGDEIFSYLVVFDKYETTHSSREFARFLERNASGRRHRIIYKAGNVTRAT